MRVLKFILIIVVVAIAYLSLTPTDVITIGNDKISHFIAYSVLMANVGLLTFRNKRLLIIGIIASVLFGVLIEIIQHFVPGRFMSFYDVLANTAGVGIGVLFTLLFANQLNKVFTKFNLR